MNEFEVYREYLALKRHFTSDYDYHYYNGKVAISEKQFQNRKGKTFFRRISRHYDPKGFLLANVLVDPNAFVASYDEQTYVAWASVRDSLSIVFRNDLKTLFERFEFPISDDINGVPALVQAYKDGFVCLETLAILNRMVGWADSILINENEYDEFDDNWKLFLIRKYQGFVGMEKTKAARIMREVAEQSKRV
jgi:hypothetical protein